MASYLAPCYTRPGVPLSFHDVFPIDDTVTEGRGVIMSTVI